MSTTFIHFEAEIQLAKAKWNRMVKKKKCRLVSKFGLQKDINESAELSKCKCCTCTILPEVTK